MSWDLVILDCDGVLVDSELIANRVMADAVNGMGLEMTLEEVMATFTGVAMADVLRRIAERLGRPPPEDFVARFRARTYEVFRRELRPVDGILAALDRITLPTCIASSGPHEKMQVTLAVTGLLARFQGRIFSADDVGRGKPHPDLFLHAADSLGVGPSLCVVVEDSVPGVLAAAAAGMRAFAYVSHADPADLVRAGARVFHSMDELPDLLAAGRAAFEESA